MSKQPPPFRAFHRWGRNAFTLIELLVVIGIVGILAAILLPVMRGVRDRGREVACLSNLRQIGAAYHGYAQDHGGYFPGGEATGYSSYRRADDPLGVPMLFVPYLSNGYDKDGKKQGSPVWSCPAGRPALKAYGTNYSWSRAQELSKPISAIKNISTTTLIWDNFTYTLPSTYNVFEPTSGGPRVPGAQYRYYPHRTNTTANYLYADGHAGTL